MSNEQKPSKRKMMVGIVAAIIFGSFITVFSLSQGTIQALDTSANPIGYYQITYELPDQWVLYEVDADIYIVNETEVIQVLHIVDGLFTDSSQNYSDTYYSHSQSYGVLYRGGLKTDCCPIECSLTVVPGQNSLVVRRLAIYSEIAVQVQIGEISPSGSIAYADFAADYSIVEGHNYSIYVSYRHLCNLITSPMIIGAKVVLPPKFLELYYPVTYAVNLTNYECWSLTVNSTIANLNTLKPVFDVTNFTYSGHSYTMIALSAVIPAFIEYELKFTATETVCIQYTLQDGALDQILNPAYGYARYGGGFD